jgi:class 3 adenylate cyclase/tetratricopeptide (TPR) repeat protein
VSESVETATILISDLVGSTGLATRVGPALADELRREHFAVLREAIATSGGEEVKNTGDGLMVAFSSPTAGVECAVAMQQLAERRNRGAAEQLHVRIGLALGEATVEDGDYFGMPSVEAARLCEKAPSDGILATAFVRMVASRGGAGRFEPGGTLELKGIAEPVEVFSIHWDPLTETPIVPLPPRLAGLPEVGFVGRTAERKQLTAAWMGAQQGHRQVALLAGEPGIGKTRLATYTALRAYEEGATVLYGRCDEDLGVAYQPWLEALRHYVATGPEDVLREHVKEHGGELARLAPELARRIADVPPPQESEPETERYLLFNAVVGLLTTAASRAPVVVVLDDLHWGDRQTSVLLRHVIEDSSDARLLVLGTFRDSELTHDSPLTELLADLRREEGAVTRVHLDGFAEADVVALLEGVTGQEMREPGIALAGELQRETDGNPFFVAELLRHLLESGAVAQEADGRWALQDDVSRLGLPESVREVVGRRVQRLGEETRRTLAAAAVIGRDFELALLSAVSDDDEEQLLDRLDAAEAASLVTERPGRAGWFTFTHALVEHTLYDELGGTRRARLHRRIAEALEQQCGEDPGERIGELAYHWSEAVRPVDIPRAAEYAARAGWRALSQLAPHDAQRWFERAVEMLETQPESELRREVLVLLGDARRQTGDLRYRDTLLEAERLAERAGDVDRVARSVLATWRGMPSLGHRDDELVGALETAVGALPDDDPRRAEVLVGLAAELTTSAPLDRRRELADEALAIARRAGDKRLLCEVLINGAFAIWTAHTIDERVAALREAVGLADEVGDPWLRFRTLSRACNVLEAGDLAGFDSCVASMEELVETIPQPFMRWTLRFTQSPRALISGRLDEAEALAIEAFEASGGSADGLTIFGVQIVTIRWEQDRLHELVELAAQAVVDNPSLPAFRSVHALALCSAGDLEQARDLLGAAAGGFASTPLDLSWSTTLTLWSEIAFQVDARDCAGPLYELLLPHARTLVWNGASTHGTMTRHLGRLALMLERYEEAEAHLAAASAEHARLGTAIWQADTDRLIGLSLLRRPDGDAERGRSLLERASETARQHGAARIAREAEETLTAQLAGGR